MKEDFNEQWDSEELLMQEERKKTIKVFVVYILIVVVIVLASVALLFDKWISPLLHICGATNC
ncbi:hypothetical protein [Paenibacillus sp. MMS18-CY102]|uniref:hypothetical protein n=1 Tax=Paenibacillus sp. MMS18-CY102 TaxID=2682849 RepID=UPI00136632E5|nr:hypothetical protein [Paenibacillus sp. MMS18-CY102]MWC27569.1 hypothetical protein [Paenibacillus sp. MMS18-CY102]